MALTDPFVLTRHFKFPVRTEYGKERRCQESYLNEFDGVAYSKFGLSSVQILHLV